MSLDKALATVATALAEPAADTAPAAITLESPDRLINRELSWLAFNERVLEEADNPHHPLLERVRFLSISDSNLDEFYMVRVAGLSHLAAMGVGTVGHDGQSAAQQLAAIRDEAARLIERQQRCWTSLQALLRQEHIESLAQEELTAEDRVWLQQFFVDRLLPVLTPIAVDPAHPFPFIANRALALIIELRRPDGSEINGLILVPERVERFIRLPGDGARFIRVEQALLAAALDELFPGMEVRGNGAFRVLRDSDMEIEEDAEDLVRYFRTAIQRRRRGRVILLTLEDPFDPAAEAMLRDQLRLDYALVIKARGPLSMNGLSALVDEERPDLKFEPYSPRYPERILEHDGDCFAAIREKDIVIQHPFESFDVVVDFLHQAAADPDVVAIKQTLYRAGKQSAVIAALIAAAEAGKSVTAVVELKARFDEEQNLHWASELENAGVQVIYGFVDWKTHAKVSMVVRREGDGYRTYCHFGTGNYHPVTARIYTDLSFFTADPRFCRDAGLLFNFITGYIEPKGTEMLAISPGGVRHKLYECIDREVAYARAGKAAAIWAKLNALTDPDLIDRLYLASKAGVKITLVVRGICCLKPGVAGLSETIAVKSVIGRFLEHSRIWAFGNGAALPNRRARVFISSADGMSRNLDRRVEVLVPIRNSTVHDQVLDQVMLANLLDTEQSWQLDSTGEYHRADPGPQPFNVHRYFMTNPSLSGRGAALSKGRKVPKLALRRGGAA